MQASMDIGSTDDWPWKHCINQSRQSLQAIIEDNLKQD
jgi:hypothetical protein